MKINLTKLLEKIDLEKIEDQDKEQTSAAYYVKTRNYSSSFDDAYSFELEKEKFDLK